VTRQATVAAIDLGASSGRVIAGRVAADELELVQAHRFPNVPVSILGTLHWDVLRLFGDILDGIRAVAGSADLASIGIDSWGVDYGLIGEDGQLIGNPVHYRDSRTLGVMPRVLARIAAAELYAITGVQQLPINTIYQVAASVGTPALRAARWLLLIPDLVAYWLTGSVGAEVTNASTTQLYDVRTQSWAASVMDRVGIPQRLFPPLRQPGEIIGDVRPDAGAGVAAPVISVASHDTASAVVAVPANGPDFAYISCGTWSLAGLELGQPVLTEASRRANFTNETGIDGTIRYLRNVMGLWLLQECTRTWAAQGLHVDQDDLAARASREPSLRSVIDPDDPAFLAPGDMPARIATACAATGQQVPETPAQLTRCILDSLALAHGRVIAEVQDLSGRHADVIHLVGGGARNALLCQLTADACGLPVIAGPAEATAIGNMLVQARALGAGPAELTAMRALVRDTQPLSCYQPRDARGWQSAALRIGHAR
jgi:sugar (pentulose or hexulose) kinase